MKFFSPGAKPATAIALLTLIGAIVYFPLIFTGFASDDFEIIYRLTRTGKPAEGFFRPLSDASLIFNFSLAGGYEPWVFHLFNVLMHIGTTVMVYLFGRSIAADTEAGVKHTPFLAAALFLLYPFHSEGVAWISGRGAVMAAFFGIAALAVSISRIGMAKRVAGVCTFYFLGLLCYESIFPLPLMILLLPQTRITGKKHLILWAGAFALTLTVHFWLRYSYSGGMVGSYAAHILHLSPQNYASHFLRVIARSFVPPMQQTLLFLIGCFFAVFLLAVAVIFYYRRMRMEGRSFESLFFISILWLISCSVPSVFPVSTHTSESDRLLYFPAVWICLLLAHFVEIVATGKRARYLIPGALLLISFIGVRRQIDHWRTATSTTKLIIHSLRSAEAKGKKIFFYNVPGEYKGAYILRNGFREALLIEGLDTSRAYRMNVLDEKDLRKATIAPVYKGDTIALYPAAKIIVRNGALQMKDSEGRQFTEHRDSVQLWYWDSRQIQILSIPR
jgi:hypothetical protein